MTEEVEISRTIGSVASVIRMTDEEEEAVESAVKWEDVPREVIVRAVPILSKRGQSVPDRMIGSA